VNEAPGLSGLREEKAAEGPAVPPVRDAAPDVQRKTPNKALAPAPAPRVAAVRTEPAALAWERLSEPLERRQGLRVGAIGITGSGKTTSIKDFLAFLVACQRAHLVLVHDVKEPYPQYEGDRICHEADEVISRPPESYPSIAVLRRRDLNHLPSVETAARVTKHASYTGVPTVLVIDEFKRALSPSGREFESETTRELLSEGRGIGASLIWTTQLPQRVPSEAYDQSVVLMHRCGTKVLSYLISSRVVDERTAAVIAALRPGQFILATPEDDFDGVIYEVPPP